MLMVGHIVHERLSFPIQSLKSKTVLWHGVVITLKKTRYGLKFGLY